MSTTNPHLHTFSVANFRSIKDEQSIYFNKNRILAAYGPNASGKTNILQALGFTKWFIKNSANADLESIPYEPFKLNTDTRTAPSAFSFEIGTNERRLAYTFAVNEERVTQERLIDLSSSRPKTIFNRTEKGLGLNAVKYGFGKAIFTTTRENSLIITKAQENNNPYAEIIFDFIQSSRFLTIGDSGLKTWGAKLMNERKDIREKVKKYLSDADMRIRDFKIDEIDIPQEMLDALPFNDTEKGKLKSRGLISVSTKHAVRNNEGEIVDYEYLDMRDDESAGTNNFFDMIVPIVDTLERNSLLYIDEFGSSLHPDLAKMIVRIFKSAKDSTAQLIINTHDTNLMHEDTLTDDEILIVEKTHLENSVIKPLRENPVFRNSDRSSIEKRYRKGQYGGVPRIREGVL